MSKPRNVYDNCVYHPDLNAYEINGIFVRKFCCELRLSGPTTLVNNALNELYDRHANFITNRFDKVI